ncbi:RNaseH domain-containing protein [Streptomyces sp. Isolate_45]|uniref:RNaseH domain-containing protein n=1 Tax=Streptomyces sp. Isolate_45 TaxID=2950111 RepID=UPI0024820FBB|nr:RNaseH domain-containing protein [Streptomyces sp. Isolate_45]MDA5282452.1 RNaseH domain-containing protein [Streptomyces sp. Isolate_45]
MKRASLLQRHRASRNPCGLARLDRLATRVNAAGNLTSQPGTNAWNPTLVEIVVLGCHGDDNPTATVPGPDDAGALALAVHRLRQAPDYALMTTIDRASTLLNPQVRRLQEEPPDLDCSHARKRSRGRPAHKTAGQASFATRSRIATHSTWWVIGKRSKTRRVRTL